LDPSGRAAEEKPAIACGPHTIEPLGKRAPEINGRGRRTEGATTSLWNLNYTTDTEGCPSNCNKLTLTSCDAATLYWWSSDDSKTHEEVHVNDWGTYWTKYYTDALKYMNKCKKIDITACYAEVIGALYKLYRQQGLVAGLEFDCKEYGRLIPDVCEKARFEKKMATQAAMDLLTIRNKCDGLESKG
jgi:hypothetical protein